MWPPFWGVHLSLLIFFHRDRVRACRRNEWRASRGLEKQKSVAEMIAEKRAAREQFAARGASSSSQPSGSGSSSTNVLRMSAPLRSAIDGPPAEPFSADRAYSLGDSSAVAAVAERVQALRCDAPVGGASPSDGGSGDTNTHRSAQDSSARDRPRRKGAWPWRTK